MLGSEETVLNLGATMAGVAECMADEVGEVGECVCYW